MEFTKENVLSLLNDIETTIRRLGLKYKLEAENSCVKEYKDGLGDGMINTADYIKDSIYLIEKYYTTEDLIDKELRK